MPVAALAMRMYTIAVSANRDRISADSDVEGVEYARPERDRADHQHPLHRQVMTIPWATPKLTFPRGIDRARLRRATVAAVGCAGVLRVDVSWRVR